MSKDPRKGTAEQDKTAKDGAETSKNKEHRVAKDDKPIFIAMSTLGSSNKKDTDETKKANVNEDQLPLVLEHLSAISAQLDENTTRLDRIERSHLDQLNQLERIE